jgi:hypothetical protein
MSLFKGMLAMKTDKSWKILYATIEGNFLIGYRSSMSDSNKLTFSEHKRFELDFAKVVRSSFQFGKKVVPAFMLVSDKKPTLFCGPKIPEWIDILTRFAGEGARALAAQPLLSEKERKRWLQKNNGK